MAWREGWPSALYGEAGECVLRCFWLRTRFAAVPRVIQIPAHGLNHRTEDLNASVAKEKRRGGDSNPRSGKPDTGFRDQRIQPLCHLSERGVSLSALTGSGESVCEHLCERCQQGFRLGKSARADVTACLPA